MYAMHIYIHTHIQRTYIQRYIIYLYFSCVDDFWAATAIHIIHIYKYMCTCMHAHVHTHIYICVCTCMTIITSEYLCNIHIYSYVFIFICMYTQICILWIFIVYLFMCIYITILASEYRHERVQTPSC